MTRPSRWLLPAALLTLTAAGCSPPPGNPGATQGEKPAAAPLTRGQPKKTTLTWTVEQPGTVHAFETTPLVAKLPGYVKRLTKDLGDPVAAGELLAVIAIPELDREAEAKAAAVAVADAEVEQSKSSVTVAAEVVHAAEATVLEVRAGQSRVQADYERWESEVKRIETLVGQKVIDAQTLDETRKQFRSAAAGRDEVAAKVTSAQVMVRESAARKLRADADLKAAHARRLMADAEARRVAAMLDYCQIKAPYAGVVTGRYVHTGHFLQPGANRSETLFTVARLDTVRVFVEVPEVAAAQATPGAKVTVRFPALGNAEVPGTITRTAGVLNADTRTLRTEIDLPNPDGRLRPGSYAVVRLTATAADALVVPPSAVLFADETAYVFAVADGKAVKMRVQVGRNTPDGVQLLGWKRATVNAGEFAPVRETDTVVTTNLGAVTDGQLVP